MPAWESASKAVASLPARGPGSAWHVQAAIPLPYCSCLIWGQGETPACELPFLSIAPGQCRQLPGTHVSTADPWCEVRPRQSTAPGWGATVPEAGSDRITGCSRIFPCISVCRVLTTGKSARQLLEKLVIIQPLLSLLFWKRCLPGWVTGHFGMPV